MQVFIFIFFIVAAGHAFSDWIYLVYFSWLLWVWFVEDDDIIAHDITKLTPMVMLWFSFSLRVRFQVAMQPSPTLVDALRARVRGLRALLGVTTCMHALVRREDSPFIYLLALRLRQSWSTSVSVFEEFGLCNTLNYLLFRYKVVVLVICFPQHCVSIQFVWGFISLN
jgi:hypothetical protein